MSIINYTDELTKDKPEEKARYKPIILAVPDEVFYSYDLLFVDMFNKFKDKFSEEDREYFIKTAIELFPLENRPYYLDYDNDNLVWKDLIGDAMEHKQKLNIPYYKAHSNMFGDLWKIVKDKYPEVLVLLKPEIVSTCLPGYLESFNGFILCPNTFVNDSFIIKSNSDSTYHNKVINLNSLKNMVLKFLNSNMENNINLRKEQEIHLLDITIIVGDIVHGIELIEELEEILDEETISKIKISGIIAVDNIDNREIGKKIKDEKIPFYTLGLARLFHIDKLSGMA